MLYKKEAKIFGYNYIKPTKKYWRVIIETLQKIGFETSHLKCKGYIALNCFERLENLINKPKCFRELDLKDLMKLTRFINN